MGVRVLHSCRQHCASRVLHQLFSFDWRTSVRVEQPSSGRQVRVEDFSLSLSTLLSSRDSSAAVFSFTSLSLRIQLLDNCFDWTSSFEWKAPLSHVIEGFVCSCPSASLHSVLECSRSPIASRVTSHLIESNADSLHTPSPRQQHQCPGCSALTTATRIRIKNLFTTLDRLDSLFCLLLEQLHQGLRHPFQWKQRDLYHPTALTELLALVEETNAPLRLHK